MTGDSPFVGSAIFIILILGVLLIIGAYSQIVVPFFKELDYIKSELYRSYNESEYRFWKKRLRVLYIRSIPFVGCMLVRLIKH